MIQLSHEKGAFLVAMNWTDEQQAAIDSKQQNLLLSAAAGSGKTAVLVGRIVARLTDEKTPIPADRLLVVTFTNAAATEMRERILASLTVMAEAQPENAFLANQLLLIKKAQITTIDAFCIDLLRQHFVTAGLSPDFRIADPTENTVMRDKALDDVLTQMYDDEVYADAFFALLESYANAKANDKMFREMVHALFLFAMSLPNPKTWLLRSAEAFSDCTTFEDTIWCDFVLKEIKSELQKCISEYNFMISLAQEDGFSAYETVLVEEREQLKKVQALSTYDSLKENLDAFSFKTRPRVPKDFLPIYMETINHTRDRIKKVRMARLREKFLSISANEQMDAIKKMYPAMQCLSEIVIRLMDTFLDHKLEKNMLDFNDCEHLCLSILVDENGNITDTAEEIKNQFDEIYIDEYQDTSKLQEAIFSAIKKEDNLFMVGDIKQSIYRFRNTDPTLFLEKQTSFSDDADAKNRKIILSKNFRSRKNVLSCVNYIFERIMSQDSGEVDYNDEQKLYPGASFPDDAVAPLDTDTQLCLINLSALKESADEDMEDVEKIEYEAILTADKIAELMESGEQIYANGVYRPVRYSDICVISRNVKDVSQVLPAVLSERGIPCFCENVGGFLNSTEIITAIAMLSVIDNPMQDIPLLTVLRSVMFGFSADTLAKIRCYDKYGTFYDALKACAKTSAPESESAREVLAFVSTYIEKSKYMSVSVLLQDLYNQTGFYDAQQTQPNGVVRRANLRLLHNRAKEFERTGLKGLYSFLQFIEGYQASGSDFDAAKTIGVEQDAVRIMSIHKSKGLEFPVVILFGIERSFNKMDLLKGVLYHANLGYGPKFVDTKLRITYPIAPRVAVEYALRSESLAEEMRILYVAMTRAKEKLIFIGAVQDVTKRINACADGGAIRKIPAHITSEADSYLDWILLALLNHPDCGALRTYSETERKICADDSRFSVEIVGDIATFLPVEMIEEEKAKVPKNEISEILPLLSYVYPNQEDTVLPTKITVTELKRKNQEIEEGSVYLFQPKTVPNVSTKKLTGAQIGTAYHVVMQHLDLTRPLDNKDEIRLQIIEIKEKGYLTDQEAGAVNPEKIVKFFLSGAGHFVLSANKVRREVMFAITECASKLSKEFKSNQDIMLQGVIDCVAETDEGLYIIDYKTEKTFSPQDTVEKYKVQLECYKMAAERIFHKPVLGKMLYLFDTDMSLML